jgi:uncharacterized protein YyaL (SSP411 family)
MPSPARFYAWLLLIASACATTAPPPAASSLRSTASAERDAHATREPDYQPLTKGSFERAAIENRIIVLSVQAAWCHWCHVMNAETLQDPEVLALLGERFLIIRVDADARPDIATRYAAWGWPATALLTPSAQPIVNLRGYQTKASFSKLLRELVARQDRGEALVVARESSAPHASNANADVAPELVALRDQARRQIARSYDPVQHGYGGPKKYPHVAPVEAALIATAFGGEPAMLNAALASVERYGTLLDPVDGGMFQYSVFNGWQRPHYEKIHSVQADALRVYAEVSRARRDGDALARARDIARYLLGPLRGPNGAFYANQDADVGHPGEPGHMTGAQYYALSAAARRNVRAPRIDTNVYANYNGMAIAALCALYEAGDDGALAPAKQAYAVIERTHRAGALYRHGVAPGEALVHLSDQVEMGYALLALYTATGELAYRVRLIELLEATTAALLDVARMMFESHTSHEGAVGVLAEPLFSLEDNARMARLLLRAAAVTQVEGLRERAAAVLSALAPQANELLIASPIASAPDLVGLRQGAGDYALALETALAPYAVLTVVGSFDDARTQALLNGARAYYHPTRLIRHDAPGEGKYPYPGEPVVYLCNDSACSMPIREPSRIAAAADTFMAAQR